MENRQHRSRLVAAALGLASTVASLAAPPLAHADSAQAYCVLSRHKSASMPEEGPCMFSQRQGNANVVFRHWAFDFPLVEDGKTYTRLNRDGEEAGPVFTRNGQYTLSIFWHQPAKEPGGW
jgi:hypothetical protein